MNIPDYRIKCSDVSYKKPAISYVVRENGRVSCILSNGIPAALSYAGVMHTVDEQGLRFQLQDAPDGETAIALIKRHAWPANWRYELAGAPEHPTHVMIDRDTVETLISVAEVGLIGLREGLNDGTYEDDGIAGIPSATIEAALGAAKAVLE